MGSKVLVGGLLPLVRRGLPTWVLLVLAFSLAWNRIEPQAVPSGCVPLCTWSLLNYFIVFWMGECVCVRARVVIDKMWRAREFPPSLF
jgi:hypothetical protein